MYIHATDWITWVVLYIGKYMQKIYAFGSAYSNPNADTSLLASHFRNARLRKNGCFLLLATVLVESFP